MSGYKDMLAELDQTGESPISLTDPDSPAVAAHTHIAVGYNVQIQYPLSVEHANWLIVPYTARRKRLIASSCVCHFLYICGGDPTLSDSRLNDVLAVDVQWV